MQVELRCVSKSYSSENVLDEIDTKIQPGTLVALVGTNGAGKTTLLKIMATLNAIDSGAVLFDDQRLIRGRTDLRRKLHYLSESPFFLAGTPLDHVCMAATLYGRDLNSLKHQIVDWLQQFDLLEKAEQSIRGLSRGQKYKVAFIGLLAANPELWLLDEPFAAGVDPTGISAIKRCINKVIGSGRIVIYSTQIVEIAEHFSDRLWVLHKGKLKVDAETSKVVSGESTFGLAGVFQQLRMAK